MKTNSSNPEISKILRKMSVVTSIFVCVKTTAQKVLKSVNKYPCNGGGVPLSNVVEMWY